MRRRDFLVSAATLAGGLLSLELVGCSGEQPRNGNVGIDVAALLPASAAVLGRELLGASPASAETLSAQLFAGEGWDDLAAAEPQSLGQRLARQIAEEHRRGDIVELRSWRLSSSEATLCCLAALGTPG